MTIGIDYEFQFFNSAFIALHIRIEEILDRAARLFFSTLSHAFRLCLFSQCEIEATATLYPTRFLWIYKIQADNHIRASLNPEWLVELKSW